MKLFLLVFSLGLSFLLSAQNRELNNLAIAEDSVFGISSSLDELIHIIESTQTFISTNQEQVELLAIVDSSQYPVKVIDGNWPENVISSINILKNISGKVKYYAEYPTSESGDWFIGYRYYFNESNGNTIAFERMANFFNSECTEGVSKELSTYFFTSEGDLIAKAYSLTSSENSDLTDRLCFFPYDYQYEIIKNIKQIMK
ncbi:MAG: hypothetical protein RIC35_13645 [Marinoscillum sp.]